MILAASADSLLLAMSTIVGLAGALGVAYTVFRSASEQRLREVDQRLINDQNLLIQRLEAETAVIRTDLLTKQQQADTYRESLTQRAAVDHLAEIVVAEEKTRRQEHEMQYTILKDILAQMRGQRGTIQ